jgi:hypothetical protein
VVVQRGCCVLHDLYFAMSSSPSKRSRELVASSCAPHLNFSAVFDFLVELKPRALRRSVKAKCDGDVVNTSAASASATLVFEWPEADGGSLFTPCDQFVEWMLCQAQSFIAGSNSFCDVGQHMQLLIVFAEHEGMRGVLLDCCLLPPFICIAFRIYFDFLKESAGAEDGGALKVEQWLHGVLMFLFKMCNLDDEGPQLVLSSFKSSGAEDFAYVVHSLMQVAADNLSLPQGDAPGGGLMSTATASLVKGGECCGCLAVDLCSMLCCASPESVSYAILSQALKPSLVMNLTLILFQRLSSPTLNHEHERLALSWLVRRSNVHLQSLYFMSLQVALEEIVSYDNIDFIDILATPCSKSVCLFALRAMMQYCFSMLLNQLPVEIQPVSYSAPPPVLSPIEWRVVCTALSLLEKFAADSHFKMFFSSAVTQPMLLFLVCPPFASSSITVLCITSRDMQVCVIGPMEARDVETIIDSDDDHSM